MGVLREALHRLQDVEEPLLVGSDRGGKGFDLWRSAARPDGGFEPAVALPEPVSTSGWEFNPAFSPDGSVLVFTARDREGGEGAGDLFTTRFGGGAWSAPEPVAQVNTPSDEYHPSFSPDGATLYFVRGGRLHEVPWEG